MFVYKHLDVAARKQGRLMYRCNLAYSYSLVPCNSLGLFRACLHLLFPPSLPAAFVGTNRTEPSCQSQ